MLRKLILLCLIHVFWAGHFTVAQAEDPSSIPPVIWNPLNPSSVQQSTAVTASTQIDNSGRKPKFKKKIDPKRDPALRERAAAGLK